MTKALLKRAPLLLVLGLGYVMWRSGFGYFASDRALVWNLPAEYGAVRRVELQVWRGEALLKREELAFPAGVTAELRTTVPLTRGQHRAVATAWTADGGSRSWTEAFDPEDRETVVIAPRAGR